MAVRDGRGDVKQTTTGFRDPRHHICQKQIPIPGYYQIKIDGLPPGSSLKKISVGKGGKMQKIQPVIAETISPARFNTLKMPIAPAPTAASVWSGVVTIEGTQTLEGNLLIQPGTEIKMGEEATLIIKGNLIAEGTSELPIRFLPITTEQQPWGAVVLRERGPTALFLTLPDGRWEWSERRAL